MATEIFYFSGTGNSFAIARGLAQATGVALTPVTRALAEHRTEPEADVIGIVFPVYYGGLPPVIKRYAGSLMGIGGKYIFAVSNYGGAAGSSLRELRSILKSRGGALAAGYGVHMPQNAFHKPGEKRGRIYTQCATRVRGIVKNTACRRKGMFIANPLIEGVFSLMLAVFHRAYQKNLEERSGAKPGTHIDQMIAMLDKTFSASQNCTGCGLCAKVCPMANIRMENRTPVWLHHCETCLACYNWCPNGAITTGIGQAGYHYRHPDVAVSDMIKQAEPK